MEINQLRWLETGHPGARMDAAMIAADGSVLGGLVNGKPVLLEQDGALLNLPIALSANSWSAASLAPDGKQLALASVNQLCVVDLDTHALQEYTINEVQQLVWEPTGKGVGIGYKISAMGFWDVGQKVLKQRDLSLRRHRGWQIAFSGDPPEFFGVSSYLYPQANLLCHFSFAEELPRCELPKGRYVTGIAPCGDGVVVSLSDHAGHYELLAVSDDLRPLKQQVYHADVTAMAAPLAQPWIAVGTVEGEVWLLDANTLGIIDSRMLWPAAPIRTLAACAEGYIVAGASDGHLALLELL